MFLHEVFFFMTDNMNKMNIMDTNSDFVAKPEVKKQKFSRIVSKLATFAALSSALSSCGDGSEYFVPDDNQEAVLLDCSITYVARGFCALAYFDTDGNYDTGEFRGVVSYQYPTFPVDVVEAYEKEYLALKPGVAAPVKEWKNLFNLLLSKRVKE